MKFRNFLPWALGVSLLLLAVDYHSEVFAQWGGYGGYHMGPGIMGGYGPRMRKFDNGTITPPYPLASRLLSPRPGD